MVKIGAGPRHGFYVGKKSTRRSAVSIVETIALGGEIERREDLPEAANYSGYLPFPGKSAGLVIWYGCANLCERSIKEGNLKHAIKIAERKYV